MRPIRLVAQTLEISDAIQAAAPYTPSNSYPLPNPEEFAHWSLELTAATNLGIALINESMRNGVDVP